VVAWDDPLVESRGHDPRSVYVERFWTPVLGPSATMLLRRLADDLDAAPRGFVLDMAETGRALGLGGSEGRRSPLRRTLARCVRFGVARLFSTRTLAVRRMVPPLADHQLARLPPALQAQHRSSPEGTARLSEAARQRARVIALELIGCGLGSGLVVERLVRLGTSRSDALEAAQWVRAVTGGGP